MHNHLLRTFIVLSLLIAPASALAMTSPASGDLIKLQDDSNPNTDSDKSVYYLGADNKRYVFPNEKTYFTWYSDFAGVKEVSASTLASFTIGGNATYRPGIRMVKITTDPKVYAVTRGGVLRWVKTEAAAQALYGNDWNKKIDDVPDAFFVDYKIGADIETAADFSLALMRDATPTINSDKQLANPSGPVIDIRSSGFAASSTTVSVGQKVTWVSLTTGLTRVSADPHPTHTSLAGFDSPSLELGAEYSFTFSKTGPQGYHNHWSPSQLGTVNVQ
jgi:plastocyanin